MATKEAEVTTVNIKIFAISKKYKVKPFMSAAPWNDTLKKYITGQENLSKAELDKQPLIIDPNENYMIRNNDPLVLTYKGDVLIPTIDSVKYKFFLSLPEIAASKKDIDQGTHLFYMENLEEDSKRDVSDAKLKRKAGNLVEELATLKDMVDMLFFFGENATNMTSSRAEAALYARCESNPKEVIAYFANSDTNAKIVFIKKLISYDLLKKATATGYIMHGSITLGANEAEAAAFVYNDKNDAIYAPLKDQLNKIEGVIK